MYPVDIWFACGGSIVETPDAREILIEYFISGGIVLNVLRDAARVFKYLQIDKARLAYEGDIMGSLYGVNGSIKNVGTTNMFTKQGRMI